MNEHTRKQLALEHCRRMNAGDLEGVIELYASDVTFEDPVGHERRTGRDALRTHFADAIAGHIRETPGKPVAGQDGAHVLLPVIAVMAYLPSGRVFAARGWLAAPADPENKRLRRESMLVFQTDVAGRIHEFRAFWGRSDLEIIG